MEKKQKSIGVLFRHKKTKQRSPDMTGEINIQYEDLRQFVEQVEKPGDVAHGNVALWFYPADQERGTGPYISVQLTPPYRPKRKSVDFEQETSPQDFFNDLERRANHDE